MKKHAEKIKAAPLYLTAILLGILYLLYQSTADRPALVIVLLLVGVLLLVAIGGAILVHNAEADSVPFERPTIINSDGIRVYYIEARNWQHIPPGISVELADPTDQPEAAADETV
jgi:hypothetical protein